MITKNKSKKDAREILGLDTREVSIVDKPAILREFLLWKRNEEVKTMGAFDPNNGLTNETLEKAGLPVDLVKSITNIKEYLNKSSDSESVPNEDIDSIVTFLSQLKPGDYPVEKAEDKEKEEDDKEKKKAEDKDKEKEKEESEDKKKSDDKEKDEDEEKNKVKKSIVFQLGENGELLNVEDLEKNKRFTGERTATLKKTTEQLLGMLVSVDPDSVKGIISDLTKTALPADVKWVSKGENTDSVTKSIEEVFAPIKKSLEDISGRVSKIEETRPAPKSSEDKLVQKNTDGNIWTGLL